MALYLKSMEKDSRKWIGLVVIYSVRIFNNADFNHWKAASN